MNSNGLKTQLNFTCSLVKIAFGTLLIILVLCGIALRAFNDKTTHKFLTAVARNPVFKDTRSQIV